MDRSGAMLWVSVHQSLAWRLIIRIHRPCKYMLHPLFIRLKTLSSSSFFALKKSKQTSRTLLLHKSFWRQDVHCRCIFVSCCETGPENSNFQLPEHGHYVCPPPVLITFAHIQQSINMHTQVWSGGISLAFLLAFLRISAHPKTVIKSYRITKKYSLYIYIIMYNIEQATGSLAQCSYGHMIVLVYMMRVSHDPGKGYLW